jgi:hypothetical protein
VRYVRHGSRRWQIRHRGSHRENPNLRQSPRKLGSALVHSFRARWSRKRQLRISCRRPSASPAALGRASWLGGGQHRNRPFGGEGAEQTGWTRSCARWLGHWERQSCVSRDWTYFRLPWSALVQLFLSGLALSFDESSKPCSFHELAGSYKIFCLGDDAAGLSLFSTSSVTLPRNRNMTAEIQPWASASE